jgi:hypothetical protein
LKSGNKDEGEGALANYLHLKPNASDAQMMKLMAGAAKPTVQ